MIITYSQRGVMGRAMTIIIAHTHCRVVRGAMAVVMTYSDSGIMSRRVAMIILHRDR